MAYFKVIFQHSPDSRQKKKKKKKKPHSNVHQNNWYKWQNDKIVMLDSENVVHLHVFNHKYLHYHLLLMILYINVPVCTHVHKTVKHNH